MSLVRPSKTGKLKLNYNWLKIRNFQQEIDKNYFLSQLYQAIDDVMQQIIERLEVFQSVNFNNTDSLGSSGAKYPRTFEKDHLKNFAFQKQS